MVDKKWKRASLSEVCEINPGKKDLLNKSKEQEVTFLPMAAVSEEGKILARESRKLKDVIKGYTNFRDGDVLLAKITPCFENGKRAIAKDLLNGIGFGSTEFHVLRPKDEVTSDWIFYAISRSDFCNIAKSQMTGTAGQKRVPTRVLEQFEIPVPSVKEQEAITDNIETQFTRLDAAIKALKAIKGKLELYRKSVLRVAFELEDASISNIEGISNFIGSGITPKGSKKHYRTEGIPFIRSQNIYPFKFVTDGLVYVNFSLHEEMRRTHTLQGDVLLNITGASIGRCAVIPDILDQANVNQHVCIIRTKENILPQYLCAFLNSPLGQNQIMRMQGGVTRQGLNYQQIRKLRLPLPSVSRQKKIIDEIESRFSIIDNLGKIIGASLAKAEKLRKSILKSAFEGKLVN
jgi:type I restriction enzyme S subunit